ncbi:MAG: SDR family oxidoreductase [Herpetosiphon sp.]
MRDASSGKVALVTGTSSGIGLSTAILLATSGYTVVATMRDTAKKGPLIDQAREAGVTLDLRTLDVEQDASVAACVQAVIDQYGHIDLLVNNAGAGYLGTLEQTSMSDLRRTMEVNFFGVWRVVQAVFPHMRAVHAGRIVTVTSVGGLIGQPLNDAYCAAKFAVEGFMESLAPVAKRLGVLISLVEPGPVNTGFVAAVQAIMPESMPLKEIYGPMVDAYVAATQQTFAALGQTPQQVAQVILEAASTATPHFRYVTSDMIHALVARKYVDVTGDGIIELFAARLP